MPVTPLILTRTVVFKVTAIPSILVPSPTTTTRVWLITTEVILAVRSLAWNTLLSSTIYGSVNVHRLYRKTHEVSGFPLPGNQFRRLVSEKKRISAMGE